MAGREKTGDICFFKRVDAASEADAGPQLQRVLDFRRHLEDTREVLYRTYDNEKSFLDEVDRHLRAYVKGELSPVDSSRDAVVFPLKALEEVKKAREEAALHAKRATEANEKAEAAIAKAEELALEAAEEAAVAALDGRLEYARQKFAKVVEGTTNIRILFLAYEFYYRTGDLDAAEEMLQRWLAASGPEAETSDTAAAYGNLGIVCKARDDFDGAEEMFRKSLAIEEALDRKEGMANQYGNLGIVYLRRDDLDNAEEMFRKSLAIEEALDRKEGMASDYGNLGLLYQARGDRERAEEMHRKSLAIEEALGRKEGMASEYCNLGLVFESCGDLDGAEEMWKKALKLFEHIGSPTVEKGRGWLADLKK